MGGLEDYPKRYCPVCQHLVRREFKPGPGRRPDAACPRCRSLERMRFAAILLDCLRPMIGRVGTLVEVAPSPMISQVLARLEAERHVRIDIGYDRRTVDVTGSLTALPLADSSVDFLMCFHVLEHIPDDVTAISEIARVLRPGGLGMLQVPWRPGTTTDEDPNLTPEENTVRFGQRDHVRFYGDDFEGRLVAAGLQPTRIGAHSSWVPRCRSTSSSRRTRRSGSFSCTPHPCCHRCWRTPFPRV